MSKMKFLAATCLSTSLLLSAGFPNVAQAEEINHESQEKVQLTQEALDYMTSFLNKYHVDNETQRDLLEKVSNGELLDSNLNKEPINTYTVESNNVTENVAVFEDGSIAVTSVDLSEATIEEVPNTEKNSAMISPFSISGGSITSGSGYTNYKNAYINQSTLTIAAAFYADFTVVNGVGSYITYVNQGYYLKVYTGYASGDSLTVVNAKETGSQPAEAILKWTYVAYSGAASNTNWLKLHLQNGKATTPWNW
ncbi:hypothetical protein V4V34_07115 [Lysinibacillus sphaericus]|uniref:hypothetical protein n=1 Tax=Lysinibacillus sphaericus TaxID=1421 RepID=UPI0018CDFFE2|nr:hypothetical protein [Lysinibacillus sphaericus]MBG9692714.1 hypothetical protein [Lysinibacillus sphaericus]MBG9756409.1 hypothetical protein [Lysinibacillus sphaericus]QTB12559.1 hypothetical protein J2B92_17105 [Lysinibacillus sphaericus]